MGIHEPGGHLEWGKVYTQLQQREVGWHEQGWGDVSKGVVMQMRGVMWMRVGWQTRAGRCEWGWGDVIKGGVTQMRAGRGLQDGWHKTSTNKHTTQPQSSAPLYFGWVTCLFVNILCWPSSRLWWAWCSEVIYFYVSSWLLSSTLCFIPNLASRIPPTHNWKVQLNRSLLTSLW